MLRTLRRRAREGGEDYVMLCPSQAERKFCANTRTIGPFVATKTYKANNIHWDTDANIWAPKIIILFLQISMYNLMGGTAVNEGIHTILIVHLQNWLRAAKVERSRVR